MGRTTSYRNRGRIHVETFIQAPQDIVWLYTQTPELHARWDARFSSIDYLPRASDLDSQRFRYTRRILPGLTIAGTGETIGEKRRRDGTATSALTFCSAHPLSIIAKGSGYWQYSPEAGGVRFLTEYDYEPRWGRIGRVLDALLARPLLTWLTALSFERLRRWLEEGVEP